ncbi:MAG: ABC transporter ATP-binding protein/permease [Faecalibacterium sp.]|nr:ABC transporter ATP-binding protein/permease [Ruminococcus sp.]MCM1391827.1 ABC transporter ATP-binding protein/permease [Ruminococcus sp.]MCM1485473.1 ABC transporter ATP-binding protein/permease [Faecalibacterium sp.]
MFKKLISFTKGYRILTILTPIIVFGDVLIQLQLPKLMGNIVDMIYSINSGSGEFSESALHWKLAEMLGLCFVTVLVGYVAARFSAIASMGFSANMRSALYNKVQDLSFENIDQIKISSLITRMTSDVSMVQSMFSSAITSFVKGPYLLVIALIYAVQTSKELSKIFYFAVPGIIIAFALMGVIVVPMFKKMLEKTDKFNETIRGNVNGIRVVKTFVREDYEKKKFETINMDLAKANIKAQKLILFVSPILMFIIYGCMIVTLYRGSNLIIFPIEGSELTTGQLTTFVSYITEVISSIMTILLVFISIIMAGASLKRIGEIFKAEPTVSDADGDPTLTVADGSVEFKDVTFKYEQAAENILENVNLKIESGETVGIIGATGSAKSTLVQLIPRLYEANEGEVLVGGRNVKDYRFENLRNDVSVVLQQNILFSGTIKDNIRWGKMDATDEEVEHAAKMAQAHEFIMEKENGYDTDLGSGGNTVSGGQRQRLCIARALLKKPKVLIFDDSTSAVDTTTDSKIKAALRSDEFDGITKIIIAQRITSIMDADRIIVIDDGKISGIGTHDELTQSNEIYKEIFISQQEGVLAQ